MRILITGGNGFIGKNLILKLNSLKHVIYSINRTKINCKNEININLSKIKSCHIPQKIDVLIHLAWDNLDNYFHKNHLKNLKIHKKFLRIALDSGIKRFIISGTCQEYGKYEGKLKESLIPKPVTKYAIAKNNLRKFIFKKQKKYKIKIQWLRIFYLYGVGQPKTSLLGQLDETIKNKKKKFFMSSGEQVRDYIHIKELVYFICDLLKKQKINGIINCSSGKKTKVIDLVKKNLKNKKISVVTNYYKIPNYEPFEFWGCNNKMKKLFNFRK
jgi:nucleoside-diphosphate-sugar epimerase